MWEPAALPEKDVQEGQSTLVFWDNGAVPRGVPQSGSLGTLGLHSGLLQPLARVRGGAWQGCLHYPAASQGRAAGIVGHPQVDGPQGAIHQTWQAEAELRNPQWKEHLITQNPPQNDTDDSMKDIKYTVLFLLCITFALFL